MVDFHLTRGLAHQPFMVSKYSIVHCCCLIFIDALLPARRDARVTIAMPMFVVETNVSENDFPEDWHRQASDLIARVLGKPLQASIFIRSVTL